MNNTMNITINNNCDLPIHKQIAAELQKQIESQELKPGQALPSVHALARALHISVNTTKQAYHLLEKEKLIHTIDDEVSFITNHTAEQDQENEITHIKRELKKIASTAKTYKIPLDQVQTILRDYYEEN